MQMGISSKGVEKAEDFTASMIKKSRVNFRPGKGLTDIAKTMAYTRVLTRSLQASGGSGGNDPDGGNSGSGGGGVDENPLG